jgi:hypothetical protein
MICNNKQAIIDNLQNIWYNNKKNHLNTYNNNFMKNMFYK